MATNGAKPTIMVVDDDEVLGQVLSRVLSRDDRMIVQATTAAQALQLAEQKSPQLALVDLCLPDVDGVELAKNLRAHDATVPLILMTAYPLRLREHPEMADHFTRILTKPLNLQELRQAVDGALGEDGAPLSRKPPPVQEARSPNLTKSYPQTALSDLPPNQGVPSPIASARRPKLVTVAGILLAVLAVGAGIAVFTGAVNIPGMAAAETVRDVQAEPPPKVELVRGMDNTLEVPKETQIALGMLINGKENVAIAKKPTSSRPLVLPGSTALDTTRLTPIRIRFAPADVIEVGSIVAPDGTSSTRELRSGDTVKKVEKNGEPTLLAILWSVDVGSKKSDLVDALVQMELDKDLLQRTEEARKAGGVPEVYYLTALRNVRADQSAIDRAESTLRTWRIPEKDIEAVRQEAKRLNQRGGKRDAENIEKQKDWPRVELRAPADGIIFERNIAPGTTITDNTSNLFVTGQVSRMLVTANAHEDELPVLHGLPEKNRHWTIRTVSTGTGPGIEGPIDDISYLIDQNQHTALVKGHIDNANGLLRGGQYITATIELPPPEDVVEIPETALVTQGRQTVVFVQPDPNKSQFTMRRVKVANRFDRTAWVRSDAADPDRKPAPEEKAQDLLPIEPLRPGERVLLSGVLELQAALDDERSKARAENGK